MRTAIVVVVFAAGLLGVGGAAIASQGRPNQSSAKITQAQVNMRELAKAVEMYRIDTDKYPSTKQGLEALRKKPEGVKSWRGPYVSRSIPLDPWGAKYIYRSNVNTFKITSYGADKKPGGTGANADRVETSY